MYQAIYTGAFKSDMKRIKKRNYDLSLLAPVINKLIQGVSLEPKYKDHALTGNFAGVRDCHIAPDWLLLYYYEDNGIVFYRTGTHSDLFR